MRGTKQSQDRLPRFARSDKDEGFVRSDGDEAFVRSDEDDLGKKGQQK